MKTIILSDNDITRVVVKIYQDGSLKFVTIFKDSRRNEEFYLMPEEVGILKENIN